MARRSSDLLEVFRHGSGAGSGSSSGRSPRGGKDPKRPKKRPAPKRRPSDDGAVTLDRRQLLYAGSALTLLLGLSFLLGLSVGRGGDTPAARRNVPVSPTARLYILGRIPTTHLLTQRPTSLAQVLQRLQSINDVPRSMLSSRTAGRQDQAHQIRIGPFHTEQAIHDFVENRALRDFEAGGVRPFARLQIQGLKRQQR